MIDVNLRGAGVAQLTAKVPFVIGRPLERQPPRQAPLPHLPHRRVDLFPLGRPEAVAFRYLLHPWSLTLRRSLLRRGLGFGEQRQASSLDRLVRIGVAARRVLAAVHGFGVP
jgi:hypothetical protein